MNFEFPLFLVYDDGKGSKFGHRCESSSDLECWFNYYDYMFDYYYDIDPDFSLEVSNVL